MSTSEIYQMCYPFLVSFAALQFFQGSEVWLVRILLRCDTYGHFGYLKKFKYLLFQEKLLGEKIVFLLEPWLRPSAFIYIFEFSTETHMYPAKSLGVMVRGVLEGFGMDTKYVFFLNTCRFLYIWKCIISGSNKIRCSISVEKKY